VDRCLSYARRCRTICGSGRRDSDRVGVGSVMGRIGLRPRRHWVGPSLDPTHFGSGRVWIGSGCALLGLGLGLPEGRSSARWGRPKFGSGRVGSDLGWIGCHLDWIGFRSRRVWLGTNVDPIHVGSGRL
jgi:hypothetical protein